jgi:starvation-inducible outer membrane lipoprotein
MRSAPLRKLIVVTCIWGLVAGCAAGIPPQLAGQVSWNLGFPDIRRYPEAYGGRVVALGGIVTHIEAVDEGYRASVSELPFEPSSRYRPAVDQPPRGRFIVLIPRQAFSSDLRPGAEVTVVGEVLGAGMLSEAGVEERVPLMEERHIKVWGPSWWPRFQIGVWGGIGV